MIIEEVNYKKQELLICTLRKHMGSPPGFLIRSVLLFFFLLNASDNELAFVRKNISLRLRLSNVFPIAAPHTKLKIYYR